MIITEKRIEGHRGKTLCLCPFILYTSIHMSNNSTKGPETDKEKKYGHIRYLGLASTIGINLVVSTFVGFGLGYWLLDKYLGTFPWFTAILTLMGIISGFMFLIRLAKRAEDDED